MKKRLLIVLFLAASLFLTSCGTKDVPEYAPPEDSTWISPGKVNIGNFFPGATAEFPLTIHNGNDQKLLETRQTFSVTTFINETIVDFTLHRPLYECDIRHISLTSDNGSDKLKATSCTADGLTITIEGFVPDDTRLLDINYKGLFLFAVAYRIPGHTAEGFVVAPDYVADWLTLAEDIAVFNPRETRDILVTITIPDDYNAATIPDSFEFWVSVIDNSQTGMVRTELCTRVFVKMQPA